MRGEDAAPTADPPLLSYLEISRMTDPDERRAHMLVRLFALYQLAAAKGYENKKGKRVLQPDLVTMRNIEGDARELLGIQPMKQPARVVDLGVFSIGGGKPAEKKAG